MAAPAQAQAATFTVNSLEDDGDTNVGDGVCASGGPGNPCTLRAAIAENNAVGGNQVEITATGTISIFGPLPTITNPITISGPGSGQLTVRRVEVGAFRPFTIQAATTISGITVANGRTEGLVAQGGAIHITGGLTATTLRDVVVQGSVAYGWGAQGGGIWVGGPKLALVDSTVRNNAARARTDVFTTDGGTGIGGGVYTHGSGSNLWIRGSTISGNTSHGTTAAGAGGNGGSSFGGGVYVFGNLVLESSTVSDNGALDPGAAAPGGAPGIARGGGVMVQAERADIVGSTIALNGSTNLGSNIFAGTGGNPEVFLKSTIVAYGIGSANCLEGPSVGAGKGFHSQGHNLSTDSSCELDSATDNPFRDPLLEPLGGNGGPTPTHAIPKTSVAVDQGVRSGILDTFGAGNNLPPTVTSSLTDQRGRGRPFDFADVANAAGGDGADIGAFERQADDPSPPAPGGGGSTPPPQPPPTGPDPGPPEEPSGPSPSQGDAIDPKTEILKGPKRKSDKAKARFEFGADESGAKFECRLLKNGGKRAKPPEFAACASPKTYRGLDPGSYTFEVRATDSAGNTDPTPAKATFKVLRP